jgi:ABC-type sulfate transport system substrate-binding protein
MFTQHGYRPADASVEAEVKSAFVPVGDLFTIRDLGGWPQATRSLFAFGGVFDRATARMAAGR